MSLSKQRFSHERWAETVEAIDLEIVQLCVMSQVRLLEPGVIDRVLANDLSVCNGHASAFEKLRGLLVLHYEAQTHLVEELGRAGAAEVCLAVFRHLSHRVGDQLGGVAVLEGQAATPSA